MKQTRHWTDLERQGLIDLYTSKRKRGDLKTYAKKIGRTNCSVSAKARSLGLSEILSHVPYDLKDMRARQAAGETYREIGQTYGVSGVRIFQLLSDKVNPYAQELLLDLRSGKAPKEWEELKAYYGWAGTRLDFAIKSLLRANLITKKVTISLLE